MARLRARRHGDRERRTITLSSAQGYDIALEGVSNGAAGTLTMTGATGAGAILGALTTTDSSRVAGSVSFSSSSAYSVATPPRVRCSQPAQRSTLSSVASINVVRRAALTPPSR